MIPVYTCVLNGFDELRHQPETQDSEYFCFTNVPQLNPPGWNTRPAFIPVRSGIRMSNHRAVRIHKMLPHTLFSNVTHSIWVDGHVALKQHPGVLIELLGDADIAVFKHPARNCVYKEIELCLKEKIGDPIQLQKARSVLTAMEFPTDAGLWCGGVIVRRHNDATTTFNRDWWTNYVIGSERDQISLPVVLRAHMHKGLKLVEIPGDILGKNDFVNVRSHKRYYDEDISAGLAELQMLCGDSGADLPVKHTLICPVDL